MLVHAGSRSPIPQPIRAPRRSGPGRACSREFRAITREPDLPKIPSEYGKNKNVPTPVATFSTDANSVTVDVAVEDAKGHFIPKLDKSYFRVSEDNVPQQIATFSTS